ncbi:MAG: sugar ABC transporter ATP-binding protein [Spirochaetaceae bacterium]|nr:sugar ABC transporter ATP-binding protein [Spirochaetaceae bacterium]
MHIEMTNISKLFGTNQVLFDANFELQDGEIHALMGENGAGKSTLMKILTGVHQKNSGKILIDGKEVTYKHPIEAEKNGIVFVYQELSSALDMSVEENLFLGREITKKFSVVDKKAMCATTNEVLNRLGLEINPNETLGNLSIGQQQLVEIAKALLVNTKVIILDEPTSALTDKEVDKLFSVVRLLKSQGVSFIYISHRMEEIFELCDRVSVLRDGRYIGTKKISDTNKDDLIKMMIGRDLGNMFQKEIIPIGKPVLEVKNLTKHGLFKNISFTVHSGEVLGFAGLMGAGRTEIMKTVFGSFKADNGEIILDGKRINTKHYCPGDAKNAGIGYIPEDRKEEGLMIEKSIKGNIGITNYDLITSNGFIIDKNKENDLSKKAIKELSIKCTGINHLADNLSGGNQQKVVFAKWLYTNPKVLILDEPTRGVDVGAKQEIYSLITKLVKNGAAVIMVSSDLPEVLGMSDRIMVIHEGTIGGVINKDVATQKNIMTLATGGTINE